MKESERYAAFVDLVEDFVEENYMIEGKGDNAEIVPQRKGYEKACRELYEQVLELLLEEKK